MAQRPSRILIVDDDLDFLRLIKTFLTGRGHEVIEARDPLAMTSRLSEHPPDLIVLDIQMPIGGAEFAQKLIQNEASFRDIPVLFCSSLPLRQMKERFPEASARRHLQKPIDLREFERTVCELLALPRKSP